MLTVTTDGPLLFIIYLNDIANISNLSNFIIYADDTTLYTSIKVILKNITMMMLNVKFI